MKTKNPVIDENINGKSIVEVYECDAYNRIFYDRDKNEVRLTKTDNSSEHSLVSRKDLYTEDGTPVRFIDSLSCERGKVSILKEPCSDGINVGVPGRHLEISWLSNIFHREIRIKVFSENKFKQMYFLRDTDLYVLVKLLDKWEPSEEFLERMRSIDEMNKKSNVSVEDIKNHYNAVEGTYSN